MKKYKLIKPLQVPEPFDKIYSVGDILDGDDIHWSYCHKILEIDYENKGVRAVITVDISGSCFCDYFEEIPEKSKSIWDLADGDRYYYFDEDFVDNHFQVSINFAFWEDSYINCSRRDSANCFLSEEEAEKGLEKRRAITRLKKYIHDNGLEFEPNWNDEQQAKYIIYYRYRFKKFYVDCMVQSQSFDLFHFKSEADAQKVIDNCESDLKIILEIK